MFLVTNAEKNRRKSIDQKKWLMSHEFDNKLTIYSKKGNFLSKFEYLLNTSANEELIKNKLLKINEYIEELGFSEKILISSEIHNIDGKFLIFKQIADRFYIITDRFGTIQLFSAENKDEIIICSEINPRVLKDLGFEVKDLKLFNPTNTFIKISLESEHKKIISISRPSLSLKIVTDAEEAIIGKLANLAEKAILSSLNNIDIKQERIGVLFSGGVDSTTLCFILQKNKIPFQAYVVGRNDSKDILHAQNVAHQLIFNLKTIIIEYKIVQESLSLIEEIIQTRFFTQTVSTVPPPVTISIAIPYFFGMKKMSQDGFSIVMTAIGTEEFFAGFEHWDKEKTVQELSEIKSFSIYQRDFYRDTRLANHFNLQLIMPFINLELALYGIGIPIELKLKNGVKKYMWREASRFIGVPEEFSSRKNKATQYGSKSNLILEKIARINGFRKGYFKQQLVDSIYLSLRDIDNLE